jgi:hypothetical protein
VRKAGHPHENVELQLLDSPFESICGPRRTMTRRDPNESSYILTVGYAHRCFNE